MEGLSTKPMESRFLYYLYFSKNHFLLILNIIQYKN